MSPGARSLAAAGLNFAAIAREVGAPRSTVRGWVIGRTRRDGFDRRRSARPDFDRLPPEPYAYLLGVYLGDGHVARLPRTYALRIYCDSRYPGIVEEIAQAIRAVLPSHSVAIKAHPVQNSTRIITTYLWWPILLPQHGPGRKHERPIKLAPWQLEITERHPEMLLRGLIHSDGCRVVAKIRGPGKTYRYPRYYLSNRSTDIKGIFCDHLDLLGIPWTRSCPRQIQIARREGVAALDRFVGPKT